MTDFARAAISYLGLPEDTVLIPSDPGHVAFQIPLGLALMAGIADRMNVLAEEAQRDVPLAVREMPSRDDLRAEWNVMDERERGRYGSFSFYMQARLARLPVPSAAEAPQ